MDLRHVFHPPRRITSATSPQKASILLLLKGKDPDSQALCDQVKRLIQQSPHRDRVCTDDADPSIRIRIHLLSQAGNELRGRHRLLLIDDRKMTKAFNERVTPPCCEPGGHLLLDPDDLDHQLPFLLAELLPI